MFEKGCYVRHGLEIPPAVQFSLKLGEELGTSFGVRKGVNASVSGEDCNALKLKRQKEILSNLLVVDIFALIAFACGRRRPVWTSETWLGLKGLKIMEMRVNLS